MGRLLWLGSSTLMAVALAAACGGSGDVFGNAQGSGGTSATSSSGAGAATGSGGSTSGPGGTSSSGGNGAGGAGGMPCNFGDDCGAGHYCNAPGCGMGSCVPTPPLSQQQPQFDAVCGCDGVSYFNDSIAATHSMSVAHTGRCEQSEVKNCSNQMPCGPGLFCSRQVEGLISCSSFSPGQCWGVPVACDPNGPKARACLGVACADICSLIQSQNAWYPDNACN